MSAKRQIYLLDPQSLTPETIAVTFAKTSRSPESFRQIAAELTDEKSAEFHEKWVVGYGHASVAEHAVLHIAVENISRLAVECLESNRLASYTEKSTRYQKWDLDSFYIPDELDGHLLRQTYLDTLYMLFQTYQRSLVAVREVMASRYPRSEGESDAAWERRLRPLYVDVCRFLLPAASLANVGVTINARALEHALTKMLSHPLAEVRAAGEEIRQAARLEVPTLLKYADHSPYLEQTSCKLGETASKLLPKKSEDWCILSDFDPLGETKVLAAALYRYGSMPFCQALEWVESMNLEGRRHLAEDLLGNLGKFDIPLRELENASFTFDLVMDQGAYFEVKRHRMMSQTAQALTTRLGYALPLSIREAGMEEDYRAAMQAASQAYELIAGWNPEVAAYLVPNGYNRRVLLTLNLRSAVHFLALRSGPKAHFSVRRVAQRMAEQLRIVLPTLGSYLRINPNETWQGIENDYFVQTE